MRVSRSMWLRCFAIVTATLLAFAAEASADPFYNVTPVASLSPAQYAAIYPVSPPIPLTAAQTADLPGVIGNFGVLDPVRTFFPIRGEYSSQVYANQEGTVIGVVPNGDSRAMPYSTTEVGYAQLQGNGQYGPFVPLSHVPTAEAFINSNNQILVSLGFGGPAQIIDLNKGTTTDFASIVSPAATQQYGYFFPLGIADNGAILADASPGGYGNDQYVVLTPPGVPVEVPAPEPTALVTIVLGLAGIAVRHRFKKS